MQRILHGCNYLNRYNQARSTSGYSFYPSQGSIITVEFSGKTNYYNGEVGGEFHDQLGRILNKNGCVSVGIHEGRKGTTTFFSRTDKEIALHILIAVYELIHENKDDIVLDEADYYTTSYARKYAGHKIDRNELNHYIMEGVRSLVALSGEITAAYENYQQQIEQSKKQLNKVRNGILHLSAQYKEKASKKNKLIYNNFEKEILNIFENEVCLAPCVIHRLAILLASTYQVCQMSNQKKFSRELSNKFKELLCQENGMKEEDILAIKSLDPVDICYEISLNYFHHSIGSV